MTPPDPDPPPANPTTSTPSQPGWEGPRRWSPQAAVDDFHTRYQKRLGVVATVCAVAGGLIGVAVVAVILLRIGWEDRYVRLLALPFVLAGGGYTFGMAVMCLFAPTAFLNGPVGKPWMKKIGTKSVTVARVVCLVFTLIGLAVVVAAVVLLALSFAS